MPTVVVIVGVRASSLQVSAFTIMRGSNIILLCTSSVYVVELEVTAASLLEGAKSLLRRPRKN